MMFKLSSVLILMLSCWLSLRAFANSCDENLQSNKNPYTLTAEQKTNLILHFSLFHKEPDQEQVNWLMWEIKNSGIDFTNEEIKMILFKPNLKAIPNFSEKLIYKLSMPEDEEVYSLLNHIKTYEELVQFFYEKLNWQSRKVLDDIEPGKFVNFSTNGYVKGVVFPTSGVISDSDRDKIYEAIRDNQRYVASGALAAYLANSRYYKELLKRLRHQRINKKTLEGLPDNLRSDDLYSIDDRKQIYIYLLEKFRK